MKDKISVIVPAYNIEEYLERCLGSLLSQTYQNMEIIVVNDGSVDGTGRIADACAARDDRVKVFHKENGGVTAARLYGLSHATGAWVGFVDGDDFVEPDMFARLLENARKYDAQISHCGYKMVFPSGKIDYYYNSGKLVIQNGQQGCTDLLDGSYIEPGLWNKLYRKELFEGLAEWLDTSIRINEDLLMNFYLFRGIKTAVYEDFCPYQYVLRSGSTMISKVNVHKLQDPLKVRYILLQETQEVPEWNMVVEGHLIYQLITGATMGLADQKELIKPHRRKVRKELRHRLPGILRGKTVGVKTKVMALWAAVWPASYGWVHRLYAKITGVDKKYSVE